MFKKVLACLFAVAAATSLTSSVVNAEAEAIKVTGGGGKSTTGKGTLVKGAIEVAVAVLPFIGGLFKGNKKECRQVACWISTPSCYKSAADQVQNQIFQGRDGYSVESSAANGAWVRYWRVRTAVTSQQTIASGTCDDGKPFSVSNCQQTPGTVHC